jgi:hypothetical protein
VWQRTEWWLVWHKTERWLAWQRRTERWQMWLVEAVVVCVAEDGMVVAGVAEED